MSDSDSGSESLDCGELRSRTEIIFGRDNPVLAIHLTEDTYTQWDKIPLGIRRSHGQLRKMSSFWIPMVLQRQMLHRTTQWAMHVGFIDSVSSDLDLNHLFKIEILEAVLRALDRGCESLVSTKHLIWLSNNLNMHLPKILDDALQWLFHTGEPKILEQVLELGSKETLFVAIQYIFSKYADFIQSMAVNPEAMARAPRVCHKAADLLKSDAVKNKGNTHFQRSEYGAAIKCYTDAIRYTPENHIIYGNRALCYIRCEEFLKAVGDGKRATLIAPLWPKGHYRYCEALFHLKELPRAIDANALAQKLCTQTSEGLKDLKEQHKRFVVAVAINVRSVPREIKIKRHGMTNQATSLPPTATPAAKVDPKLVSFKAPHAKGKKINPEVKADITSAVSNDKLPKQHKSATNKSWKDDPRVFLAPTPDRKYGKDQSKEKLKTLAPVKTVPKPKSTKASPACIAGLRSAVQDGYVALADLRCWLAEKAFSQALAVLQTATLKELGISLLDEAVLHYGRASALIEIGQPQELAEAQREFRIIKSFERRTFECLVYYGIGRVYFKENRFKDALSHFTDSMQMVNKRITPGKLTWPLTKEIVKETQLDYFKESLSELMESCTFPPEPDAICRHGNCIGHIKTAIYFTDPDFKGFIRLTCCQGCVVEYHISCWKSLKITSFSDSNEKDFLQRDCFTPDCRAAICSIQIYGSTGLIKCKFETVIKELECPKKFRVNQKCSSLKKLQSKEERKLRRKQQRQAFKEALVRQAEQDAARDKQPSQAAGPHSPTRPLHRDRVLFQVEQNRKLLAGCRGDDLTALLARMQPWVELDRSRGNLAAARLLDVDGSPRVETLGQIVDLLLERRNRVWARVLVEFLGETLGGSLEWARELDTEGLIAAAIFIDKHAGQLEDMDPSPLLRFAPLQDVLVSKFDSRPELLSQSGIALTEYLRRAAAQDVRVFIWTLEEHRDQYHHCHTMLDEFFDILDGDCLIMKKSDHVNENNSPMKNRNRGRKKNQKDHKAVVPLKLSGMRGDTQGHEQDSLSFFHSNDPFSVPYHLRQPVATFESQYNPPNHKSMLDNNPDPIEESIYDYFAQILEEHGPLDAQNPLLLGQLDHFPAEARQKMEACGGLRAFLLKSLRFILVGERVGLARHAVALREAGCSLDALDVLEHQGAGGPTLHGHAYDHLLTLPCPYPYYFGDHRAAFPSSGDLGDLGDLDLYSSGGVGEDAVSDLDFTGQVYPGDRASAAVNSANGYDTIRGRQPDQDLEDQIETLVADLEKEERLHQLEAASLKKKVEETHTNIQVTNKEVELFQQKLEEMVRGDQKEKKANHEELKALKTEIEGLAGKKSGLSKSLQEKRKEYDKQLRDFCDLSNQSAAEKMSLVDEIKRCHDVFSKAAMRSQKAELSILEINRKQSLYCLQKSLSDSRDILLKLEEAAPRYPAQVMALFQQRWRSCVQEATEKIAMVEGQYKEQMEQVNNGVRLRALPQITAPNAPEPPVAMTFSAIRKFTEMPQARHAELTSSQHRPEAQARGPSPALSRGPSPALPRGPSPALPRGPSPALPRGPSPAQAPIHPPSSQRPRPQEPQQATRFDKILEQLGAMFPVYSRTELMKFIETFRLTNGGALTSVNLQELLNGVSQIILDQQAMESTTQPQPAGSRVWPQNAAAANAPLPTAPLPTAHAWQPLGPPKQCITKALNTEDPCIICHEDMPPEIACVLSCRHSFHRECIKSWLKEQSTCPTCRKHALLPEDFPMLAGRRTAGRAAPSLS